MLQLLLFSSMPLNMEAQERLHFQLAWQKPWPPFPNQRLGNRRGMATPHGLLSFVVRKAQRGQKASQLAAELGIPYAGLSKEVYDLTNTHRMHQV